MITGSQEYHRSNTQLQHPKQEIRAIIKQKSKITVRSFYSFYVFIFNVSFQNIN